MAERAKDQTSNPVLIRRCRSLLSHYFWPSCLLYTQTTKHPTWVNVLNPILSRLMLQLQPQCPSNLSCILHWGKPHPTAASTRLKQTPTAIRGLCSSTLSEDPSTPIQPCINLLTGETVQHWHVDSTPCVYATCYTVATNKCMKKKDTEKKRVKYIWIPMHNSVLHQSENTAEISHFS